MNSAAEAGTRSQVRQFTREEADELVRLARIAGAEVGITSKRTSAERDGRWVVHTHTNIIDPLDVKAMRLSLMHLLGPDAESRCDAHRNVSNCGLVTVTDALLGRLCHKAMSDA